MNEITGKILKYNRVVGKMPGIQIETEEGVDWYNATETTEKYVTALKDKVGSTVKIKHDDRKISFVTVTEDKCEEKEYDKAKSVNTSYKTYTEKKDLIITRQVAVKAAAEIIKSKPDIMKEGSLAFFDLAEMIEHWIVREPKEA